MLTHELIVHQENREKGRSGSASCRPVLLYAMTVLARSSLAASPLGMISNFMFRL